MYALKADPLFIFKARCRSFHNPTQLIQDKIPARQFLRMSRRKIVPLYFDNFTNFPNRIY